VGEEGDDAGAADAAAVFDVSNVRFGFWGCSLLAIVTGFDFSLLLTNETDDFGLFSCTTVAGLLSLTATTAASAVLAFSATAAAGATAADSVVELVWLWLTSASDIASFGEMEALFELTEALSVAVVAAAPAELDIE
jgi:hypothetical protein